MSNIEFLHFEQVDPDALLAVVNQDSLRTHLIDHPYFDRVSLKAWMESKIELDSHDGCRVRAVSVDGVLAGWCGIQPDESGFELAIVISQGFWGAGISIFRSMMVWAGEMGHKEVVFHLLETRPKYRSLAKMASKVERSEQLGRSFTTYTIPV